MSEYPILPFYRDLADDSRRDNPRQRRMDVKVETLVERGKKFGLRLSAPEKMPCPSWSLQAWDTCAGARNKDGSAVDACDICYARKGRYIGKTVMALRAANATLWEAPDWSMRMAAWMNENELKYFRWFDSGDIMHLSLARKIYEVMKATPNTQHWLPTRTYKFAKFKQYLDKMEKLPNVVVRYSSDSVIGKTVPGKTTSTIAPTEILASVVKKGGYVCPVYSADAEGKNCDDAIPGGCRACWSKKAKVICYPAH